MGWLAWKIGWVRFLKPIPFRKNKPVWLRVLLGSRLDVCQCRNKVAENFGRHHDGVAVATDIFGDFHHHAASISLEIEIKSFPIGENFFRV